MSELRVLYVDDEPDIRELVEMSLSLDPELTIKSCSSGTEGLAVAAEWMPDIILMDVMMPVMDGPQTLVHLREDEATADIPVVFMTARAQARELAHFLTLGAAGVISKPFDPMTLAGTVKQYLKTSVPTGEELKRRFALRARSDAASLAECRLKFKGDPSAAYAKVDKIAKSLLTAGRANGFDEVGSGASVLARMVEDAQNGIGALGDVERSIDKLISAIERDCGGGDVEQVEQLSA